MKIAVRQPRPEPFHARTSRPPSGLADHADLDPRTYGRAVRGKAEMILVVAILLTVRYLLASSAHCTYVCTYKLPGGILSFLRDGLVRRYVHTYVRGTRTACRAGSRDGHVILTGWLSPVSGVHLHSPRLYGALWY